MQLNRGWHGSSRMIQSQIDAPQAQPVANQTVNLIELPVLPLMP
jgi:hypothetical protein